jgi:hypothetical protein
MQFLFHLSSLPKQFVLEEMCAFVFDDNVQIDSVTVAMLSSQICRCLALDRMPCM